ncbi:hypothetical protein IMZ48_19975 [Candidatus Bathyarchaeota archaeon]|nr:hypothetical protein [Candidatus Bathyarchaeota archaeon]
MALYPNALHTHAAPSQINASIEPPYSHAPSASLHTPMHHFPAAAQPSGQGGESGYDCPFPPARAPQFGLDAAPQYAMSDPSSLNPMAQQTNPPTFGHPRLSRDFTPSDPAYQQQARTEGHAGEQDNLPHRERKRRQSECLKTERAFEEQSPESDEMDERASLQNSKKPRAAFSEEARRETGVTRKTGACIRCRIQRSRVRTPPTSPYLIPTCLTCYRSASRTRMTQVASAGPAKV